MIRLGATLLGLVALFVIQSCQTGREQLVFSSSRNGNSDIFVMRTNGKGLRQLTSSPQEEWAPDVLSRNTIVFLRQGPDSIYRVRLELDSGREQTIPHPSNCLLDDKNTLHGPGGRKYVYPCGGEIFLQEGDGPPRNISGSLTGTSNYLSWSPDGAYVLFTNNGGGSNDLYQYSVGEGVITQLTDDAFNNERGSFSPDNALLLYSSNQLGQSGQDLILLNRSTKQRSVIRVREGTELIGRWGTSGKHLYFGSNGDGNWEIYRYSLKSQKIRRLTDDPQFDGDPRLFTVKN
ncbi:PD40 domain-containing protein [Lewinella sp. W8]|uniref:TolB family protein n=1 Tax=Lewinella sp. W8 TaxID=2528208 RepID=UPI001067CCF6|nr:PD40 domain-containing protein [Lewinella sp. W8]MTB49597.1 hypothetical protein [Lewinella sp. W8]